MRVAVSQFATSLNVQDNLATCIRIINETAVCEPSLIVLPEFCNTLSWYEDHNHAWNEAIDIEGNFLQKIAEQARKNHCYIAINVTLRRDLLRDHQDPTVKSNISVTSCLFSPLGELIQQLDKQSLVGHENDFFICHEQVSEVVTTPIGKLGFLIGSDDSTFEPSRSLALSGAQLLCHSMHSFALEQSSLHGPARASDNKVFLVSANKVGSLISQSQASAFSAQSAIPQACLAGVGQSQIISPNGKVLAKITNDEEGFVFADIDLTESNEKVRPDGTDLIKQRRPELYQELTLPLQQVPQHKDGNNIPETVNVAIFATYKTNEQAIEDVCHYIVNNLSDIIQLPELFFIEDKAILQSSEQLAQVGELSKQLIHQVSAELRPFQYVCTSLVIDGMHQAVIISEHGLFATQQQLHFCQRYQWTALGDTVNVIELPLEQGKIKLAMLTADDANIPEIVKIAALNNIHLLLVPFDIQEPCEVEYSLLSRAAENRICIIAASREKSFAGTLSFDNISTDVFSTSDSNTKPQNKKKVKSKKSIGFIANLTTDSALLTQWKSRGFNGYINPLLVKYQHGKITKALIHPIAASNKLLTIENIWKFNR